MSGYYSNKTGGYSAFGGNKGGGAKNGSLAKDDKLMCSIDKKWERADQFSNNEQKKYLEAKRRGKPYNPRCRKHTQAPSPELTCSNCDRVKVLAEFSNAQRKADPDVRRCRNCVAYTETLHLYDELNVAGPYAPASKGDYDFPSQDPSQALDEAHYSGDESEIALPAVGGSVTLGDASANTAWSNGHSDGRSVRLTHNGLNTHDQNTPRFPPQGVEGSYGPSSAPSVSASVASTETPFHHPQGATRSYTAYGPAGQVQRRGPSGMTPSESTFVATATTAADVPMTRSGWAKVPTRKIHLQASDATGHGAKDDDHEEPKRYDYYSDGSEDEC